LLLTQHIGARLHGKEKKHQERVGPPQVIDAYYYGRTRHVFQPYHPYAEEDMKQTAHEQLERPDIPPGGGGVALLQVLYGLRLAHVGTGLFSIVLALVQSYLLACERSWFTKKASVGAGPRACPGRSAQTLVVLPTGQARGPAPTAPNP